MAIRNALRHALRSAISEAHLLLVTLEQLMRDAING